MGGALGLGVAHAGLRFLVALGPASLPRLNEISIDPRALAFTLAVSLLSGLLFGLIPALKYAGPQISLTLRSAGRTSSHSRERHRARNLLVVAQVALALVLLVSSGLMIRTSQALRSVDPGLTSIEQLQTLRLSIPVSVVPDPERVARMENDIVDTLQAIPGVTSAAFTTSMPMEGIHGDWDMIQAEGVTQAGAGNPPLRIFKDISPGFFQTSGIKLAAGRDYNWADIYGRRHKVLV